MDRASGILLPISSLPSPYGIGTLGQAAYAFADFLHAAGPKYWQLLPLGPTSAGDSPYHSFPTFAGTPYFTDLAPLAHARLPATAAPAPPAAARRRTREPIQAHPHALTFLPDASRTGYPGRAFGPPLGLEPEDPLCRVELTLSDPDGTGTVTRTQDGARACTYRVFQDYQEVRDRYPLLADYITALRERWLETYPQADPST